MFVPFNQMPSDARVWVYQSSREFSESEIVAIGKKLEVFLESWTAHQQALRASYEIRYNRFVIVMIDEQMALASGCSIDKSVKMMKELEAELHTNFFDRMLFAFKSSAGVEVVSRSVFEQLVAAGKIIDETIVFNNLVTTKAELDISWEIPLAKSWHKQLVG